MRKMIDMANDAGMTGLEEGGLFDNFLVFEALVRADERESCAKVCDELHWPWHMGDNSGPKECAAAIRARGK